MRKQFSKKVITILAIILLISPAVYCQEKAAKKDGFRIKLNVSASESLRKELNKCLTNELNAINDTIVVDNNPEWELSILAETTPTKDKSNLNIMLSVLISNPFLKNIINVEQFLASLNPFQASYMRNYFSRSGIVIDHWLRFDVHDNLTKMCKDIVADFDSKYLEKSRQIFQRSKKLMKGQKAQIK